MNNVKSMKPNLLNPIVEKKLKKTLLPTKENTWEPIKQFGYNIWRNFIRKNIVIIVIILLIVIFLVYRYRVVKKRKEDQEFIGSNNSEQLKHTQMLLDYYKLQKELAREPKFELAYPMYPYTKGELVPNKKN